MKVPFLKLNNKNVKIILSFVIIAIFSSCIMVTSNKIHGSFDFQFHVQRIEELVDSIDHHNFFPRFALNAMGQNGGAAMSLYPYISLLPVAIFLSIFKFSVTTFYLIFIFSTFLSLMISYYSSITISKNIYISYIFALLYSTSSMYMNYWFNSTDVGVITSSLFLPLVIFGYINLLKNYKWMELTIGMSLMIFSHILSPLITIAFLILWSLFNFRSFFDKRVIISLIKAVITTIMVTAIFWIPAMVILKNNQTTSFAGVSGGIDAMSTFINALQDGSNATTISTLSLFAVVGMFLTPFFHKKLNNSMKKMYLSALIFWLWSTSLFPWNSINDTPLRFLQFTWRLDFVPQLIFIYSFSYCIIHFRNMIKLNGKKLSSRNIIITFLVIAGFLQLYNQYQVVQMNNSFNPLISKIVDDNGETAPQYGVFYSVTDDQIDNFIHSANTNADYYPTKTFDSFHDLTIDKSNYAANINGTTQIKDIRFKPLGNGNFEFNNEYFAGSIKIPFIVYNGINYSVKLDGKTINYGVDERDSLMSLINIPQGQHHIAISVKNSFSNVLRYLISVLGLSILVIEFMKNRKRNRKKQKNDL